MRPGEETDIPKFSKEEAALYRILKEQCYKIWAEEDALPEKLVPSILIVCDIFCLIPHLEKIDREPESIVVTMRSLIKKGYVKKLRFPAGSPAFVPMGFWSYRTLEATFTEIQYEDSRAEKF